MQNYLLSSESIRADLVHAEDLEDLIEADRQVRAGDFYKALRKLRHLIVFDDRSLSNHSKRYDLEQILTRSQVMSHPVLDINPACAGWPVS
jgi:flagellar biosynthesis regulator FlbT